MRKFFRVFWSKHNMIKAFIVNMIVVLINIEDMNIWIVVLSYNWCMLIGVLFEIILGRREDK